MKCERCNGEVLLNLRGEVVVCDDCHGHGEVKSAFNPYTTPEDDDATRCANKYCGKPATTSCDACSAKLCDECALSADGGNAVACPPCARGEWEEWGVADE